MSTTTKELTIAKHAGDKPVPAALIVSAAKNTRNHAPVTMIPDARRVVACEKLPGAHEMADTDNKPVVYIVDDDESVRRSLSRLMRSAGIDAVAFESAERFLAQVNDQSAGCVLLDITMPHITGPQVQERLNRMGIKLPVIAVSARDDDETRTLARSLGARFFFRKPVDGAALLDALNWVMGSNQQQNKSS